IAVCINPVVQGAKHRKIDDSIFGSQMMTDAAFVKKDPLAEIFRLSELRKIVSGTAHLSHSLIVSGFAGFHGTDKLRERTSDLFCGNAILTESFPKQGRITFVG